MRRFIIVLGTAVALGVVLQLPQWLHMSDARYRGIPVQLNSDEGVYIARVEEGLTGRPGMSSEAFIGDPRIRGSQPAMLEAVIGAVFAPLKLRAQTVLQIMDILGGILFFLALYWFYRECRFTHRTAYVGTIAVFLLQLYNLNRPIHQGLSAVLLLTALSGILAGLRGRFWLGTTGGLFLGLLFGDYFWSWSFGWLWFGLLCLWTRIDRRLVSIGIVGIAVAAPFIFIILRLSQDPLYAFAIFRSGMHPSHLPESWMYSALFVVMAAGTLWSVFRSLKISHLGVIISVLACVIAIHQQVVHGQVFNFVSHYLLFMVVTAASVIMLWWHHRHCGLAVAAAAAVIYLAAVGYDGRHLLRQYARTDGRFGEQHFSPLLPVLDALPRSTILSDPHTSMFLAGATKHDVVYALYIKNLLMTHEEIAARYCLTQVPIDPAKRDLEHAQSIYPDADAAFNPSSGSGDPSVPAREIEMLKAACAAADKNPREAINTFQVQYVLWDEQRNPAWNVRRLRAPLTQVTSGSGWTLFRVSVR